MSPILDYQVADNLINKTLQNKAERSNIFKQNFSMLRCAHAHYLEQILIVSINKIQHLMKQKSNNFYVILQTILCVYYVEEIVFFLYQLNYLSKPKKKRLIEMLNISTGFHTTNNDACLKVQKQTHIRRILCIF